MLSLISVGGQHRGVYGVPRCLGANHTLCDVMREPDCYDLALCDAIGAYGERM